MRTLGNEDVIQRGFYEDATVDDILLNGEHGSVLDLLLSMREATGPIGPNRAQSRSRNIIMFSVLICSNKKGKTT